MDEELTPDDEEELTPEELAFSQSVHETILREMELPFGEVLREYRRIEEEFVVRAGDNEELALDFKRRVSKQILSAACRASQPYEACRGMWEELVERGFSDHEQKRIFTGIYARCCQMNGEFHAGIAVLEPLIAEIEQSLEGTTLPPKERGWYEKELRTLCRIRDELEAGARD